MSSHLERLLIKKLEDSTVNLHIIPQASVTGVTKQKKDVFVLKVACVPEKGKGNKAILGYFKKKLGVSIAIVKGLKSRDKIIQKVK